MATVHPVIRPIIAHSFSPMAIFYTESCVKRKDVCVCVCVCALAFKCLELVRFVLLIFQKKKKL